MTRKKLQELLEAVAAGELSPREAVAALAWAPVEAVGAADDAEPFARIDQHRTLRQGYPEVVLCQGKTIDQVATICERIATRGHGFLATRAGQDLRDRLVEMFPAANTSEIARTVHLPATDPDQPNLETGPVLVVSGGTSDLPVAEEAVVTARAMGNEVERLYDVGVAGVHRLLGEADVLTRAAVIIVVAGMEGALASVVGGLVDVPVIAVPTSVGYGASFGGLAALLGMLNSCAAGITVVNIDNGFGAASAATRMIRPFVPVQ